MIDYSQYEEQKYILEFFKNNTGTFLDIGAADGITFSNVYQLLLNGWSGISVEPETRTFRELVNNYNQFGNRSELVIAVIDPIERFVTFYENGQLSSTSEDHMRNWEQRDINHKDNWYPVTHRTTTLNSLLQYYSTRNFDFISIDLEGQNLSVVCSTDWNLAPACKLLCIEHDNLDDQLIEYLARYGFTVYKRTSVNILMGR